MISIKAILSALFGSALNFAFDKYKEWSSRQKEAERLRLKIDNRNLKKGIEDARERRDLEHDLRLSGNDDISRKLRESREKIRELRNSRGR